MCRLGREHYTLEFNLQLTVLVDCETRFRLLSGCHGSNFSSFPPFCGDGCVLFICTCLTCRMYKFC